MNTKGFSTFVGILIGLVILAAGVGIYLALTKQQATGPQTYRNDKYGFEFQYPEDVKVETGTSGNKFTVHAFREIPFLPAESF